MPLEHDFGVMKFAHAEGCVAFRASDVVCAQCMSRRTQRFAYSIRLSSRCGFCHEFVFEDDRKRFQRDMRMQRGIATFIGGPFAAPMFVQTEYVVRAHHLGNGLVVVDVAHGACDPFDFDVRFVNTRDADTFVSCVFVPMTYVFDEKEPNGVRFVPSGEAV